MDVRDVVSGLIATERRGVAGGGYILSGHLVDVREIAGTFAEIAQVPPPRVVLPNWMARAVAPATAWACQLAGTEPFMTKHSMALLSRRPQVQAARARRELGFRPRPLRETLQDLHEYFAEAGLLRVNAA